MANVHLLRHVRTRANLENRFCGWSKSEPLIDDLDRLRLINAPDVDMVFCSPMERCVTTARSLGYEDFTISERLKEINFGTWEMRSFEEICRDDPVQTKEYLKYPSKYRFPGGESLEDLRKRAREFMEKELFQNLNGECDMLIVSHSGTLRALMIEMLEQDMSLFWKVSLKPGRFSSLRYNLSEDGTFFMIDAINADGW